MAFLNQNAGLLNILNSFILTVTLIFIAIQASANSKMSRVALLQSLYDRHYRASNKMIDSPDIAINAMREETRTAFMRDGKPDPDKVRQKFTLDMIIDEAEYFFLLSKIQDKEHNRKLVKRMMSNQNVVDHWHGPYRGTVRSDFKLFVEQYYKERDAK